MPRILGTSHNLKHRVSHAGLQTLFWQEYNSNIYHALWCSCFIIISHCQVRGFPSPEPLLVNPCVPTFVMVVCSFPGKAEAMEQATKGSLNLMEPAAKKIKLDVTPRPRLEAVLDDSVINDLDLVAVCIGRILSKKAIRSVILDLNAKHPIPSLAHLKRVRNDKIILKIGESLDGIEKFLQDLKIDCTNIGSFEVILVARTAPITRRQFEVANKRWPCNFHENKALEKIVNTDFSEEELVCHEKWMRVAVQLAKGNGRCSAAVVVDPSGDVMVSKSVDDRGHHPLQHAVMLAVDLVACSQGGGAWMPRATRSPCKGVKSEDGKDPDGPYLCTGYDVYTTREPCIMCAMALVHSRANRVFYGTPAKHGALGSAAKIHLLKELNHHYEAYRYLLHDECALLDSR